MKKYFMFVAVAAAGMLASCSSDSLTAGPDPNIEPTQEERVPIQLSVSSPSVRANTRGTGTVGGVGAGENKWYGQTIKVFMFTKDEDKATTLNLTPLDPEHPEAAKYYDDAEMITPGTGNLTPTGSTSTNIGEAMLHDGTIQYYPPTGNYDFFGYHVDDAINGEVDSTTAASTLWTVPFKITGSQDLLSTKAALTGDQATTMATLNDPKDYYSAKSARKSVQPVLSFKHLLSRLSFVIIPGNNNAGGWVETTPAVLYADVDEYNIDHEPDIDATEFAALSEAERTKTAAVYGQDAEKAVYVQEIKVKSKTTGKMAVAWTGDAPEELITWDEATAGTPDWLTLKERPAYYKTDDRTITLKKAEYAALPFYYKTSDPSVRITPAAYAELPVADPGDETDWQGNYTELTAAECSAADANIDLIALTPTFPVMHHAYDAENLESTPIGEALIVAPSEEDYEMEVTLTQKVPTNWNTPAVLTKKTMTYPLKIKAPVDNQETPANEAGFQKNISYQVNLTVYGFERIVVTTEIKPWDTGAPINVGQDD